MFFFTVAWSVAFAVAALLAVARWIRQPSSNTAKTALLGATIAVTAIAATAWWLNY